MLLLPSLPLLTAMAAHNAITRGTVCCPPCALLSLEVGSSDKSVVLRLYSREPRGSQANIEGGLSFPKVQGEDQVSE